MDVYTDGSYLNGVAKWAFIVVEGDEAIYSASGIITDPEIIQGWQIGGEIQAMIEAINYGKSIGRKVRIFADYVGCKMWVADLWGGKPWKTNKPYSQAFREFVLQNQEWLIEVVKVEAHTGNYWNEKTDELASKSK